VLSHLLQFWAWRWQNYWLWAKGVGFPLWWICMGELCAKIKASANFFAGWVFNRHNGRVGWCRRLRCAMGRMPGCIHCWREMFECLKFLSEVVTYSILGLGR
jgi:hypothetical protein